VTLNFAFLADDYVQSLHMLNRLATELKENVRGHFVGDCDRLDCCQARSCWRQRSCPREGIQKWVHPTLGAPEKAENCVHQVIPGLGHTSNHATSEQCHNEVRTRAKLIVHAPCTISCSCTSSVVGGVSLTVVRAPDAKATLPAAPAAKTRARTDTMAVASCNPSSVVRSHLLGL